MNNKNKSFFFGMIWSDLLPLWYLRNLDSSFLFWIQEKMWNLNGNFQPLYCGWTMRKSVLAQTRDTFMPHTPDTSVIRLIVWLTGINCPGRPAVCTCWVTGTFYPVFHHGFGPISFCEQDNGFCLFWSSSRVNTALAHDQSSLTLNVGESERQPARKIANVRH